MPAQPTPNAVHVGDPDVVVAQGNHLVSIESAGVPPQELALEVLHLPWRSWHQLRHKVEMAGAGYEASPDLRPSPNHHGMIDYARLGEGVLLPYAAARHVTHEEAAAGPFTRDETLPRFFAENGLTTPEDDVPLSPDRAVDLSAVGRALVVRDHAVSTLRQELVERGLELDVIRGERDASRAEAEDLRGRVAHLEGEVAALEATVAELSNRRVVRTVDAVAAKLRRR